MNRGTPLRRARLRPAVNDMRVPERCERTPAAIVARVAAPGSMKPIEARRR